MQTASFNGFIRTLFYFLAFYYIIKFLARLFLPLLVKKVVEKAGENFHKQQQGQDDSWKKNSNDEEVVYNASNAKKPHKTKKVGDYVDYEEID